MSKIKPVLPVALDHGIDAVVRDTRSADMAGMADLLDLADVAPPDASPHSQLDQLLALPSIDEFIAGALRPSLDGAEILSPPIFRAVLDESIASLRQMAERDPRVARKLGRAARELANRADLLDLLRMYRSALLQG